MSSHRSNKPVYRRRRISSSSSESTDSEVEYEIKKKKKNATTTHKNKKKKTKQEEGEDKDSPSLYEEQRHQSELYKSINRSTSHHSWMLYEVMTELEFKFMMNHEKGMGIDMKQIRRKVNRNVARRFIWNDLFGVDIPLPIVPANYKPVNRNISMLLTPEYERLMQRKHEMENSPLRTKGDPNGWIRKFLVEVMKEPRWIAIHQLENMRKQGKNQFTSPLFHFAFAEFWLAVAKNTPVESFQSKLDPRIHNVPFEQDWHPFPKLDPPSDQISSSSSSLSPTSTSSILVSSSSSSPAVVKSVQCQPTPYPSAATIRISCPNLVRYGSQCELHSSVRVRPSGVPFAGLGLFAWQDFPSNSILCAYADNAEVSRVSVRSLSRLLDSRRYMYSWNSDGIHCSVIDAHEPTSGFGRFINDARSHDVTQAITPPFTNNAKFVDTDDRKYDWRFRGIPYIKAIREIRAGEEIFIDYGTEYWDHTVLNGHYATALHTQFQSRPQLTQNKTQPELLLAQEDLLNQLTSLYNTFYTNHLLLLQQSEAQFLAPATNDADDIPPHPLTFRSIHSDWEEDDEDLLRQALSERKSSSGNEERNIIELSEDDEDDLPILPKPDAHSGFKQEKTEGRVTATREEQLQFLSTYLRDLKLE
jgi:hypothetical protein